MSRKWKGAVAGAAALALSAIVAGAAQAKTQQDSFSGGIAVTNPCDGQIVSVSGNVYVQVNENQTGHGGQHASVHLRFDGAGDTYAARYEGSAQFDAISSTYIVPIHAVWVGLGASSNFGADGTARVFMTGDVPTGAVITSETNSCTNN
jgi:hypothetical protein